VRLCWRTLFLEKLDRHGSLFMWEQVAVELVSFFYRGFISYTPFCH